MKVALLIFFFSVLSSLFNDVCHGRPQPVVFSSSPKRLRRILPPPLINFWHGAQNSSCVNKSSQPLLVSVSVNTVGLYHAPKSARGCQICSCRVVKSKSAWLGSQSCCRSCCKPLSPPPLPSVWNSTLIDEDIVLQLRT